MFNLKTLTSKAAAISAVSSFGSMRQRHLLVVTEKLLRIQSVLGAITALTKYICSKAFGKDVAALNRRLIDHSKFFQLVQLSAARDVMDAVDAGLVEGGFAWTHYWGGKHVAANLYSAHQLLERVLASIT